MEFSLKHIKYLILDMDGVLWRGHTPMPNLAGFFQQLDQLGIQYVLATNNTTSTVVNYQEKLEKWDIILSPEHILTSAIATASYLQTQYPVGTPIYAVGGAGIQLALREASFTMLEAFDPQLLPEVVVVGLDLEVTYQKLAIATLAIRAGAAFYGTNPDTSFPFEGGQLPGAGSLQAAISAATSKTPTIIGKPEPIMFQEAMRRLQANPAHTAMVGDRLNTDILGGKNAGIHTILLLSGVTTASELANSPLQPNAVFTDINDFIQRLQEAQND